MNNFFQEFFPKRWQKRNNVRLVIARRTREENSCTQIDTSRSDELRSASEHHFRLSDDALCRHKFSLYALHTVRRLQNVFLQRARAAESFLVESLLVRVLQLLQALHRRHLQSGRLRRRSSLNPHLQDDKPRCLRAANHASVRQPSQADFRQIDLRSLQLRLFACHDGRYEWRLSLLRITKLVILRSFHRRQLTS